MNRPLKVLLVEDSALQAKYIVQSIPHVDKGITINTVASLSDAVTKVIQEGVDVVLLDLVLPDAQDVEAVVKLQHFRPDLPIVVLSGSGSKLDSAVLRAGAQDCIDKGSAINPAQLVLALRHAVIRQEVINKYASVRESMKGTEAALADAGNIEAMVQDKIEK